MRRNNVRGYTLRSSRRVRYVGITNNPLRRLSEHRDAGRNVTMRVETGPKTRASARNWEQKRIATYRRSHGGRRPPLNKR